MAIARTSTDNTKTALIVWEYNLLCDLLHVCRRVPVPGTSAIPHSLAYFDNWQPAGRWNFSQKFRKQRHALWPRQSRRWFTSHYGRVPVISCRERLKYTDFLATLSQDFSRELLLLPRVDSALRHLLRRW